MSETMLKVEEKVKVVLSGEATGHDWYHIKQVRDMALRIAEKEGGDKEVIKLAALVHEVGDRKFYPDKAEGLAATRKVLVDSGVSVDVIEKVMHIADTISFSGGKIPESLEGKIVQDADRMFALGAIGIARAFAFGGKRERMIYDPVSKDGTTIQHFYDKLLLVGDKLNTKTAKEIASGRHAYMEAFLKQFYAEWEGSDQ